MKCRKCNSTEYNPSKRNPIEKAVGEILPIRTYRCNACEHRFWGLDKPLFRIGRVIFASIVFLSILWLGATWMLSGTQTPREQTNEATLNESGPANELDEEPGASPVAPPEQQVQNEGAPVENTADEAATAPGNAYPVSNFVQAQLEKNREKQGLPALEATTNTGGGEQTAAEPVKKAEIKRESSGKTLFLKEIMVNPTGGTSLSLVTEGTVSKPKLLRLGKPDRLVVDLPGSWSLARKLPHNLEVGNNMVQKIRLGAQKDYLRIVFDLNTPKIKDPTFIAKTDGLEIQLTAQE